MTTLTLKSGDGFGLEISDEMESGRYGSVRLRSCLGEASKKVYSLDLDQLVSQLEKMVRALSGAAEMQSLEDDFRIRFEMLSLGHVRVEAALVDHFPSSEFKTAGEIDQSFLPPFIADARNLALVPYWKDTQ